MSLLPPICISTFSFVYLLAVCIKLLAASVYHTLRILPPKPPPLQIGFWIMQSPLSYFAFFYSVQSSHQSQRDTPYVQFPNDCFQMNSHFLSQRSLMNESNDQWPLIPENCFISRPICVPFPQPSLGMFNPGDTMRQIHRNDLFGCGFQRPGHFPDLSFIHCEPIPVIYWLEHMPHSYPFGPSQPFSKPNACEAKVAPTCNPCSMRLDSNEVLAMSPVSLGPTNATSLSSSQVPPDWSFRKLPHKIPQRQFECTYPGCDRQFRRRTALERHLICHSDERPYVCWVPECHRSFKRSDNLKAHYLTHAKMGGRNRYVAKLDKTSSTYSPEFRGRLTLDGWPAPE